jgi:hypothetical protein
VEARAASSISPAWNFCHLSKLGQVQPSPQYSKLILIVESPLLRVGFIKQGRSQPQLKFSQSNRAGVKNAGHPWQLLVKDPVFLATPTQNGVCVMLDWLGKREQFMAWLSQALTVPATKIY